MGAMLSSLFTPSPVKGKRKRDPGDTDAAQPCKHQRTHTVTRSSANTQRPTFAQVDTHSQEVAILRDTLSTAWALDANSYDELLIACNDSATAIARQVSHIYWACATTHRRIHSIRQTLGPNSLIRYELYFWSVQQAADKACKLLFAKYSRYSAQFAARLCKDLIASMEGDRWRSMCEQFQDVLELYDGIHSAMISVDVTADDLTSKFNEHREWYEDRLDRIQTAWEPMQEIYDGIVEEKRSLKSISEDIECQLADLESSVADINTKLEWEIEPKLEERDKEWSEDLGSAADDRWVLGCRIDCVRDEVKQLENNLEWDLEHRTDRAEQDTHSQKTLKELNDTVSDLKIKYDDLDHAYSQHWDEIVTLQRQYQTLQENYSQCQQKLNQLAPAPPRYEVASNLASS